MDRMRETAPGVVWQALRPQKNSWQRRHCCSFDEAGVGCHGGGHGRVKVPFFFFFFFLSFFLFFLL